MAAIRATDRHRTIGSPILLPRDPPPRCGPSDPDPSPGDFGATRSDHARLITPASALMIPAGVVLFRFSTRPILPTSPSPWTSAALAFDHVAARQVEPRYTPDSRGTGVVVGETFKSPPKNDETSE